MLFPATPGQRAQIVGILCVDKIGSVLFVFALGVVLNLCWGHILTRGSLGVARAHFWTTDSERALVSLLFGTKMTVFTVESSPNLCLLYN